MLVVNSLSKSSSFLAESYDSTNINFVGKFFHARFLKRSIANVTELQFKNLFINNNLDTYFFSNFLFSLQNNLDTYFFSNISVSNLLLKFFKYVPINPHYFMYIFLFKDFIKSFLLKNVSLSVIKNSFIKIYNFYFNINKKYFFYDCFNYSFNRSSSALSLNVKTKNIFLKHKILNFSFLNSYYLSDNDFSFVHYTRVSQFSKPVFSL